MIRLDRWYILMNVSPFIHKFSQEGEKCLLCVLFHLFFASIISLVCTITHVCTSFGDMLDIDAVQWAKLRLINHLVCAKLIYLNFCLPADAQLLVHTPCYLFNLLNMLTGSDVLFCTFEWCNPWCTLAVNQFVLFLRVQWVCTCFTTRKSLVNLAQTENVFSQMNQNMTVTFIVLLICKLMPWNMGYFAPLKYTEQL